MATLPRVTVWNEFRHEKQDEQVKGIYPSGIHEAIAAPLRAEGFEVETATLDEPDQGLPQARLDRTEVLIWWGHAAHHEVDDNLAERVHRRVLEGMGLIALHSAHFSKIFRRLMGTTCDLKWRDTGERELIWVVEPGHPIAAGLGEYIDLAEEEMYGERFDIPAPDTLLFVSWFQGGEIFRSGCCYQRGKGKVFYFRPGHESFPTFHHPDIQRVIANAARWAAPVKGPAPGFGHRPHPLHPPQVED